MPVAIFPHNIVIMNAICQFDQDADMTRDALALLSYGATAMPFWHVKAVGVKKRYCYAQDIPRKMRRG